MNARMPKLFLAVCLGAATLALWGCKGKENVPKTEFVLFDLSASTATPEVRARYVADFERLLANVNGGDILVVDRINSNPLAQSTFPVNETFKRMNPWLETCSSGERNQKDCESVFHGRCKRWSWTARSVPAKRPSWTLYSWPNASSRPTPANGACWSFSPIWWRSLPTTISRRRT